MHISRSSFSDAALSRHLTKEASSLLGQRQRVAPFLARPDQTRPGEQAIHSPNNYAINRNLLVLADESSLGGALLRGFAYLLGA